MPYLHGELIGEIEEAVLLNNNLTILFDTYVVDTAVVDTAKKLSILNQYLRSVPHVNAKITMIATTQVLHSHLLDYGIRPGKPIDDPNSPDRLKVRGAELNADLIFSNRFGKLSPNVDVETDLCPMVDIPEILHFAEVFARGFNVPWSCNQPVWNLPWTNFYTMTDKVGMQLFDDYTKNIPASGFDKITSEIFRTLMVNRFPMINYLYDNLLFYKMQIRYVRRCKLFRQPFKFEASQLLSHYYLSISAGLDQLARILKKVLNIEWDSRYRGLNFHGKEFVRKVREKNARIGDIIQGKSIDDWLSNIWEVRNHIAHQGTVSLSQLVEKPEEEPNEAALVKQVRALPEYLRASELLHNNQLEIYERILLKRLSMELYKKTHDYAMIILGENGFSIRFPLNDVEWNFANFRDFILNVLNAVASGPRLTSFQAEGYP